MGLSTKKTSSKTNQNTSMTTTPNNPTFVTEGIEGLAGKIKDVFGGLDPSKMVAGANPLQTQASGIAAGLGQFTGYNPMTRQSTGTGIGGALSGMGGGAGKAPGGFAGTSPTEDDFQGGGGADPFIDGLNMARGAGSAGPNLSSIGQSGQVNIKDSLGDFMNPYMKDVVDTSLADFDFGAGQQRGQAQLDLANDTTFGGSGGALYKSALEGELARGRGALSAGLHSDGYDKAVQAATAQAGLSQQRNLTNTDALNTGMRFNAGQRDTASARSLAGASTLAGIGGARDANTRANAGTQFDIGAGQRDIQNQQNRAPIDLLLQQIASFSGLPIDALRGSTSTGTMDGTTKGKSSGAGLSDWLDFFKANAQAAAAAGGSDLRLKDNIKTTHYDAKGRRWVDFTYKGDPETVYNGVIAQEVRETDPHAVIEGPAGILFVNYAALEA